MPELARILITGNRGYIGSVMAPWLKNHGYDVVGLDTEYFRDCSLIPDLADIPTIRKDIRDVSEDDLSGFDAVIHLAALSNDPIGNLNKLWTWQINTQGTARLAERAKKAGVRRFIFSSSCIMYGMAEAAVVNENSPLAPQTDYARSKVDAEKALNQLADENFSPAFCRNGTIYGLSPRMRFDTVLNNFLSGAFCTGRVVVHSDGTPWRPVVHVEDVARAFQAVLEAPRERIHNQAFNIGADHLNHQVRELGAIATQAVAGSELEIRSAPGADQRTYKTDFGKFKRTFPTFEFWWDAKKGARELYTAFQKVNLTHQDFTDPRFTRLSWLCHLLDKRLVDASFRWSDIKARVA
jgi:nucleoside-diphosphate-sugar epimerase